MPWMLSRCKLSHVWYNILRLLVTPWQQNIFESLAPSREPQGQEKNSSQPPAFIGVVQSKCEAIVVTEVSGCGWCCKLWISSHDSIHNARHTESQTTHFSRVTKSAAVVPCTFHDASDVIHTHAMSWMENGSHSVLAMWDPNMPLLWAHYATIAIAHWI